MHRSIRRWQLRPVLKAETIDTIDMPRQFLPQSLNPASKSRKPKLRPSPYYWCQQNEWYECWVVSVLSLYQVEASVTWRQSIHHPQASRRPCIAAASLRGFAAAKPKLAFNIHLYFGVNEVLLQLLSTSIHSSGRWYKSQIVCVLLSWHWFCDKHGVCYCQWLRC